MRPKFSIIIPVYNVAPYLRECLDSVLSQTVENLEVLAVDDGSTDGSGKIIDEYAVKDQRITVLHKGNGGVSSARNAGIDLAKGEYLCFVDGDDIVSPTYLQDLYEAMGDADSSMGGFKTFGLPDKPGRIVTPGERKVDTLEENLFRFYDIQNTLAFRYLWNRMFRASIIRNRRIRFQEDIYYKEDGLFVIKYLCQSNGMVGVTDSVIYNYRRTPNGAIGSVMYAFDEKLLTILTAHVLILQELREKEMSNRTLSIAIFQAQSVSNWLLSLQKYNKKSKLHCILKIEQTMKNQLGWSAYLKWRLHSIVKPWK